MAHLRIARPSRDLARAGAFWVGGLGLQMLERVQPHAEGEHELVMPGWPAAAWHLELVADPPGQTRPPEEDLLVLYLGQPADPALIQHLAGAGGRIVPAGNP